MEMVQSDWSDDHARCLGMWIAGTGIVDVDSHGQRQHDDDFLILLNAHHDVVPFTMPTDLARPWRCLIDTISAAEPVPSAPGEPYPLQGRSLVLLQRLRDGA